MDFQQFYFIFLYLCIFTKNQWFNNPPLLHVKNCRNTRFGKKYKKSTSHSQNSRKNPKSRLLREISRGWRPGAISKRLLSMLNKAKRRQSNVEQSRPVKRTKKRVEEKPTLIVCKRNGEYIIEMQVEPDSQEGNVENYSPLIYKIASKDNEDRIKRKARKQRRLIRKAVKEGWSDHYDPDACQRTCFKAYQQAIGLLPYDPNNPDCTCPDEEQEDEGDSDSCSCDNDGDVSSECSSLDVDWELHFSPPIACYNNE